MEDEISWEARAATYQIGWLRKMVHLQSHQDPELQALLKGGVE